MKSRVTLYYKSLVNKEKNFVLDDASGVSKIDTYLATLTGTTIITGFQYVKHQLSVSIKLDKNQTNLEMVDSKDLNYVKIENYTDGTPPVYERAMYYFVINKIWRAKDTIELVLSMDTLNSFRFNYDYRLNKKTLVKRMHKDRFEASFPNELIWRFIDFPEAVEFTLDDSVVFNQVYNGKMAYKMNENDVLHYLPIQFVFTGTGISRRIIIHTENESTIDRIMNNIRTNEDALIMGLTDENEETFYISFIDFYAFYFFNSNKLNQLRIIDLKSEDISSPVYKKFENTLMEQNGEFDNSWVLYYKNRDNQEDSPIECYLTSDELLDIVIASGLNQITISDIPSGKILFICPQYQGELTFDIDNVKYYVKSEYIIAGGLLANYDLYHCIGFQNDEGTLKVHIYQCKHVPNTETPFFVTETEIITSPNDITIDSVISSLKVREVAFISSQYNYSANDNPFFADRYTQTITLQPLTSRTLAPSSTIDKTLSDNVKIINIPYCPSTIEKTEDGYVFNPMWEYQSQEKFFKLVDFTPRFENNIETNLNDILTIFTIKEHIDVTSTRFVIDSKLYHSDYYRMKFVYDSFNRIFPLEQIDYKESFKLNPDDKFKFTFVMSRNIVSKFLFKFDYVYKHSNEDYPNIVAVSRNNEEVLYNSSYLNYIRTGYNYDLKAKERQEVTGAVGIGLNIAGLLASIGLSFIPGGQAFGIAGAVGAGIGLASQMINYAKTTAQNEENIQRKLQETSRQSVSVLNADDYDLLYAYTQNKAKLSCFEVSEQMKHVLDDLFYYCGYVVNEQMIPNISSRYWFNFIQASLSIDDSSNLSSEIEDDIKEKFEQGVTFLHYSYEEDKFDLSQEMENWEVALTNSILGLE